jgi:hypothetical protein
MAKFSVEQQIAALRSTVKFASHMNKWLLGSALIGLLTAITLWHPVPLMLALFLGVIGISERQAGPNIVAAISAYDSGTPTLGKVLINATRWDSDTNYHATVMEQGHPDWTYEFVPQGWQPNDSSYPAHIWRISDGKPVLVIIEDGVLVPRHIPCLAKNNE